MNRLTSWANGTQEGFPIRNYLVDAGSAFTAKIDGWDHLILDVIGKMRLIVSLCV